MNDETQKLEQLGRKLEAWGYDLEQLEKDNPYNGGLIDFDSDEPIYCNRDQSDDEACEACQ